ncbi:MAG: DUF4907 domain-containing protein [Bacteroidetes bacterium]|nr:DUF4907 domain-containing protein [Bacteroidota bacterium]
MNIKLKLLRRGLALFFVLVIFSCQLLKGQQIPPVKKHADLYFKIIPAFNDSWGYDIYHGAKLYIHQPVIPAVQGNTGFATKQLAEKVAKKVIEKILKGESPPAITLEELKKMGAVSK